MGQRCSWLAVKGVDKDRVLETLGLVETGEVEDPYAAIADLSVAQLPGWTVVRAGSFEFFRTETLSERFAAGEVVGGQFYENANYSTLYGHHDGRPTWSVVRDIEKDREDVAADGALPAEFAAVRDQVRREQAAPGNEDVDVIIEIPLALSGAICGFRPDRDAPGAQFMVVEARQTGAAGERQDAAIAMRRRLDAAIEGDLIPAAQVLGFQRASDLPPDYPAPNSPTMLVRFRDGLSEILDFRPGIGRDGPSLAMSFFVRKGMEFRRGAPGLAQPPSPKRSFFDIFGKSRESPEEAFARVVAGARDLLPHVDSHLKDGTQHPDIKPARYYDPPEA